MTTMGIYEGHRLVDSGQYESVKEAKADFYRYDQPRGRNAVIEDDEEGIIKLPMEG